MNTQVEVIEVEAVELLTVEDCARLERLEAVIERGQKIFVEVGNALMEIRDARLYRDTHETFEAYCQERWGWSASRSRQLIAAAKTVTAVTAQGLPAPKTEGEARRIAKKARARDRVVAKLKGDLTKVGVPEDEQHEIVAALEERVAHKPRVWVVPAENVTEIEVTSVPLAKTMKKLHVEFTELRATAKDAGLDTDTGMSEVGRRLVLEQAVKTRDVLNAFIAALERASSQ